jgi:hypothetical protein
MDEVVNFSRLGNGEGRQATKEGRVSAFRNFEEFLSLKKYPNKSGVGYAVTIDDLSHATATDIATWQEYGGFLVEGAVDARGDSLMKGTALQYLSACRVKCYKIFSHVMFQSIDKNIPSPFTAINKEITSKIGLRCIHNGEFIAKKSRGVARANLLTICKGYLKVGNKAAVEKRAAIVTSSDCVGRSGEVAFTCFDTSFWDATNASMSFDWNDKKNAKQNPMNMFPDAQSWEMDWYDSMGDFALVTGGINTMLSYMAASNVIF